MTHELETFYNLSPEPFCLAGIDTGFRKVNPAFERILGWTSAELSRRSFLDLVHPNDRMATRLEMKKLAKDSRCVTLESRFRCADGSHKWLRCTAYPGPDHGLFYAFGQDITELKRARDGFRLAIESSPCAMIVVDSKGKIVLLNRVTEALFKYDRGQLLGQSVEMLVPDQLRNTHSHHREDFFELPTARPMGSRLDLMGRRRDGSEFPVEVGLQPVETNEGTLVISAIVDLTARKQAEQNIWRLARQSSGWR